MTKKQQRHIIASIGTLLFLIIVFLLLWFVYMTAVKPEEEEGIEIAFGQVEEAGGFMAEQSEVVPLHLRVLLHHKLLRLLIMI